MTDTDGKTLCEHCGYENRIGALLCKNCYRLLTVDGKLKTGQLGVMTNRINTSALAARQSQSKRVSGKQRDTFGVNSMLRLLIHGINAEIVQQFRAGALMIGRTDESRKINPEIDLSRYEAIENGVSRCHALIRREGNRLYLRDLGSVNGTYVNGEKLSPHMPRLIAHGDTVRLGTLVMQIFFD